MGGLGDIFGGIKGFLGLATGGPVSANTPYVVGEAGPELFLPNTSGSIVPNNRLGGQTVVNNHYITNQISAIDAKGVAQLFYENRQTLFGTVEQAKKELPFRQGAMI
jgi:phage-related minor tail protein